VSSERGGAKDVAAARPPLGRPQACPTSCRPVHGPSRPPVHCWLSDRQRESTRNLNWRCRHDYCRDEYDSWSIMWSGPIVQGRHLRSRVLIAGDAPWFRRRWAARIVVRGPASPEGEARGRPTFIGKRRLEAPDADA
jgi:hypothetical protein